MKAADSPRPAVSALIIAFCLWHMSAILLYNIPYGHPPFDRFRKMVEPYILTLSQWQYWDVFSPDPMRRVATFVVERNAGDRWETALVMSYDTLPWWLRVKEMKVLDRIAGNWRGLTVPYLSSLCPLIPHSSDTDVRLIMRYHILPADLQSLRHYAEKPVSDTSELLGSVRCPRAQ